MNSPFQRLRRSLLLLLQLLALLGLVLAASKPIITGAAAGGRNLLVLLDSSASMNTREEGGTRAELARNEARKLVEGMVGGDRMAVIAFAARSNVLQPLTADRTALARALDLVPRTSLPGDLLQALRTTQALAESLPAAEVYVIGDGAYGSLAALPLELQRFGVKFLGVGKVTENAGITELDVRRSFGANRRVEIFASVQNFSPVDRRVALGVYRDERLVAAAELELPKGQSRSHTFDAARVLSEESAAAVTLRLEIDQGGALEDDDRAYLRILPPQRLKVLVVGEANPFLERVLGVQPQVDARRVSLVAFQQLSGAGALVSDPAQVLIFDRAAPPGPPDRPALYIGCAPEARGGGGKSPEPAANAGAGATEPGPGVVKAPIIVDWDRSHPVNRFLAFADLRIEESLAFPPARGYRSLIDSGEQSIAGTVTFRPDGRPPVSAVIVGFDVLRSNWPWLHSFPIFIGSALEWLGAAAGSEARPRYRTGEVLTFYPGDRKLEAPTFRDPAGRDHAAPPEPTGELAFAGTDLTGIYELRAGGEVVEAYPVSLLSAAESEISPRKELQFGAQVVRAQEAGLETRDLWKWFALAALALITLEWWVYNKRMHI